MYSTADKARRAQRRWNWANAARSLTIIGTAVVDQLVVLFLFPTRQEVQHFVNTGFETQVPQMIQIMLSVMGYAP
jgi:hypothetical protein